MTTPKTRPKASVKTPKPVWAWHVHHRDLVEKLVSYQGNDPFQERLDYIQNDKPLSEVGLRVHLFRKVKNQARIRGIMARFYAAERKANRATTRTEMWQIERAGKKERDAALKELHRKELGPDAAFWKPSRGDYLYGTIFPDNQDWQAKAAKRGIK